MARLRIRHYHAYVAPALLCIAGLALIALPTVERHGDYFGGGPLREWTLNHLLLPALPDNLALSVLHLFNQGDVLDEWLLCAPVVLLLVMATTPVFQLMLHLYTKSVTQ